MRYLLIDRITSLEVFKRATAIKNVALSEDVFTDHFLGFPVMPGALLIEALAQTITALLEVSTNFKKKAILVIVEQAKFRSIVHPGDQLIITAEMISYDNSSAKLEGTVKKDKTTVMNARMVFVLKEVEQFYPKKTRHLTEALYDFWLKDARIIGLENSGVSGDE